MAEETQQVASTETQTQSQSASIIDSGGKFTEGWADRFPEADRATLSRFKSIDDFGTSHMALRRMSDKDPSTLIEIPTETSSDEIKTAFNKARGVPETIEGYKYERNPDLPDTIETSPEKITAFSEIAKKWDLTDAQFNGVANDYLALIGNDITASDITEGERVEQQREAGVAVLKKHLGNALEERTLRAEALMRKYGNKVVKDAQGNEVNILEELYNELPGIENSPWMRLLLDSVAEDMSEGRIKGFSKITTATPSAIQDKIDELRKDKAYMDESHLQHKKIIDEISELYKKKSA